MLSGLTSITLSRMMEAVELGYGYAKVVLEILECATAIEDCSIGAFVAHV